jgi:predicted nucleic acid-binding protein
MAAGLLLDTDVLIDFLRGVPAAVTWLNGLSGRVCISTVTVGELYAGVRDGLERKALDSLMGVFDVLAVDEEIARRGGLICRDFRGSHGVGLPDALLAATALIHNLDFVTLNLKHFPMLSTAMVPYQKVKT